MQGSAELLAYGTAEAGRKGRNKGHNPVLPLRDTELAVIEKRVFKRFVSDMVCAHQSVMARLIGFLVLARQPRRVGRAAHFRPRRAAQGGAQNRAKSR